MATDRQVILVCDSCGTEDKSAMVETHRVSVDSITRDAEMCAPCWQRLMTVFVPFASGGREPEKRKVKKDDLLQWPDTEWRFSKHAMQRMVERSVTPVQVLRVLSDQELRTPGKYDGEEVWVRDGFKVVVHPSKRQILTVAKRDSDHDALQAVG